MKIYSAIDDLLHFPIFRGDVLSKLPSEMRARISSLKELLFLSAGVMDLSSRRFKMLILGGSDEEDSGRLRRLRELFPMIVSTDFMESMRYLEKMSIVLSGSDSEVRFFLKRKTKLSPRSYDKVESALKNYFPDFFSEYDGENLRIDSEWREISYEGDQAISILEGEIPSYLKTLLQEEVVDRAQIRLSPRKVKFPSVIARNIDEISWIPVYGASPSVEKVRDLYEYVSSKLGNKFLCVTLGKGINAVGLLELLLNDIFSLLSDIVPEDDIKLFIRSRFIFDSAFEFKVHSKDQYPYVSRLCSRPFEDDPSILRIDDDLSFNFEHAGEGEFSREVMRRIYDLHRIHRSLKLTLDIAESISIPDFSQKRSPSPRKSRKMEVPVPPILLDSICSAESLTFALASLDIAFPSSFREVSQEISRVISDFENAHDVDLLDIALRKKIKKDLLSWEGKPKGEKYFSFVRRGTKMLLSAVNSAVRKMEEECKSAIGEGGTLSIELSEPEEKEEPAEKETLMRLKHLLEIFKDKLETLIQDIEEQLKAGLDLEDLGISESLKDIEEDPAIREFIAFMGDGLLRKLDLSEITPFQEKLLMSTVFSGLLDVRKIITIYKYRDDFLSLLRPEAKEKAEELLNRVGKVIHANCSSLTISLVLEKVLSAR